MLLHFHAKCLGKKKIADMIIFCYLLNFSVLRRPQGTSLECSLALLTGIT